MLNQTLDVRKPRESRGLKGRVRFARTSFGLPISRREVSWIYIALVPFAILFIAFTIWPLFRTVQYSLHNYDGIGDLAASPFTGIANYVQVLTDPLFQKSYLNTWIFTVGQTLIKLPLSFLVAILLTRVWLRWKPLFRVVFFLPWLMPSSIVAMVFYYLLNPTNGAINQFLIALGITQHPIDFLSTGPMAFTTIAVLSTWQIMGQYVIFWMAALQLVPQSLYEAAEVEGANGWQKMWYITIPVIRPMIVIISTFGLIWSLGIFDWIQVLTAGGPGSDTYVVNYFVYEKAFAQPRVEYGIASAAAFLFGVTVLLVYTGIGYLVNRANMKRREYGI